LWRCAPSQLRHGTERERAQQELLGKTPWTFNRIVADVRIGEYTDVTPEGEPHDQEPQVVDPEEVLPEEPPRRRRRMGTKTTDASIQPPQIDAALGQPQKTSKRALQTLLEMGDTPKKRGGKTSSSLPLRPHRSAEEHAQIAMNIMDSAWFSFEESPEKVIEIAFPAMENPSRVRTYLRSPEMFVVTSLRKKRVEINEKKLTPEERELIRFAKGKEVKEFIKENVVARLLADEHVNPDDVMKMRFVLTWKQDPDSPSGKKGKARLVVLGFQDPYLGKETTCSPTLNKRSKQMLLQVVVQNGWQLYKGDVTAAFLQGRPLAGKNKYALAPPELAEAMGLPPGERVVRLLKSVYGLTTAPLDWYLEVDRVLRALGGHRCVTDPCVWTFCDKGKLIGIIGAHVDDFLIAGQEDNSVWKRVTENLLASFRWTPWEKGTFKQCGVRIQQLEDMSIVQDQEEYLQQLEEMQLEKDRAKQGSSPVTEKERTELRALLGALQWLVTQSRPDASVDVNLIQSEVTTATVDTILTANKIVRKLKSNGVTKLFTKRIDGEPVLVCWSDASWANRKDAKSTGGYVITMTHPDTLEGKVGHHTILGWASNKLKRVARSSLAAEVQAMVNGEDELHLCRACWAEFQGVEVNLEDPDDTVRTVRGAVIIDAKSIYDTLSSQTQPLQLSEKRTALDLLAYIQNTELNGTDTLWCHGEANISDSLTKVQATKLIVDFMQKSEWALVRDPQNLSGRKRRQQGKDLLESDIVFKVEAMRKIQEVWPGWIHSNSESDDY
jgi:hypothetical protein